MLRILKTFYRFISCKKGEVEYEEVTPSKDITPTTPVEERIVKYYDYNYGTRYY